MTDKGERLNELLAERNAHFIYDVAAGTWLLCGTDQGLYWETDDFPAASQDKAIEDAIAHLEAQDDDPVLISGDDWRTSQP